MTDRDPACRLYLVTPPDLANEAAIKDFAPRLAAALDAGDVASVLLRAADLPAPAAHRAAEVLCPLVQSRDVAFVVDGAPELAAACDCDGVHLAAGEMAVGAARAVIGPEAIVGVACDRSRHDAMVAAETGADYVAFGTWNAAPEAALRELLAWWQETMVVPCVAMGAADLDDAAALARAGADFLALDDAVWRHPVGVAEAVAQITVALAAPG